MVTICCCQGFTVPIQEDVSTECRAYLHLFVPTMPILLGAHGAHGAHNHGASGLPSMCKACWTREHAQCFHSLCARCEMCMGQVWSYELLGMATDLRVWCATSAIKCYRCLDRFVHLMLYPCHPLSCMNTWGWCTPGCAICTSYTRGVALKPGTFDQATVKNMSHNSTLGSQKSQKSLTSTEEWWAADLRRFLVFLVDMGVALNGSFFQTWKLEWVGHN